MADKPVKVLKASGEYEPFLEEKVRSSLQRAGAEDELIEKIISQVKRKLYEGISTKEIYSYIFGLLRELESPLASKYNLKQAIMELGPSGYPFEKFVAGVLKSYGYLVEVGQMVQGKCVSHEIDVIAEKGNEHFMIECKFHNRSGIKVDIQTALYSYARFLDVKETWVELPGHRVKFHQPWLVTNTKVSSEVKTYGQCVGLKVLSWDYPAEESLRFLIEQSNLHPLTCLTSLSRTEKTRLLEAGIVFCRDLLETKNEGLLPALVFQKAQIEAAKVCQNERL